MKFYAHHFFSTLRIFYVKMVTSEGLGFHILSCDRADFDVFYLMQSLKFTKSLNSGIISKKKT